MRQLDADMEPNEPCFATMVQRCHRCFGKYFSAWRDSGGDVLGEHTHIVKEGAFLELHLMDQLNGCGASVLPDQVR